MIPIQICPIFNLLEQCCWSYVMGKDKEDIKIFSHKGTEKKLTASEYKTSLQTELNVSNSYTTRVTGKVFDDSEIYDKLSETVTAIDWGRQNAGSRLPVAGWNKVSLNLTDASAELVEICRQELIALKEIKNDRTLSPDAQDKKINEEKKYLFSVLNDIRNANSKSKNVKWLTKFCSSLGDQYKGASKATFRAGLFGIALCIVLPVIAHAVGLAALGVFAPYALPFVFAAVGIFVFYKLAKAFWNAGKEAYKEVHEAKEKAGDKILSRVAKEDKFDLKAKEEAMNKAKAVWEPLEAGFATLEQRVQKHTADNIKPLDENIGKLEKDTLAQRDIMIAQKTIMDNEPDELCEKYIAAKGLHDAAKGKIETNKSTIVDSRKSIEKFQKEIVAERLKFSVPKDDYDKKKGLYNAAKAKSETSGARASKEPATPSNPTLKERLGEEDDTASSTTHPKPM